MALTGNQQRFIERYLANGFNATEAARHAGYGGDAPALAAAGSRLLKNVKVAAKIKERMSESAMPADEVLARLADHARGSLADFFPLQEQTITNDDGTKRVIRWRELSLEAAAEAGKLHLLKSYSKTAKGERIELHDAQAALIKIGEHHQLWGKNDILKYIDLTKLNDDQLSRLANGEDPLSVLINATI